MLYSTEQLYRAGVSATDGEIGSVRDAFFDDERWTLRYFIVETGGWLLSRKVLIAPQAIRALRPDDDLIDVSLTREQVKNSPDIDTDKPISRQHEMTYLDYYGYGYYWAGPLIGAGGMGAAGPIPPISNDAVREQRERELVDADPHLRSVREVSGYHIQARDGEIGHLEDLLFDDETWMVRYLLIDTRNWLPGRRVLVAPDWVDNVSWAERKVTVDLTREAVAQSPEFTDHSELTGTYERALYEHYGQASGGISSRSQTRESRSLRG